MAQLYQKMQFYENRTTSRKHHLQKFGKNYNLKSKKLALCIWYLENLKYKKMAQLFAKLQFYENHTRSRRHHLQKIRKNANYNIENQHYAFSAK